MSIAEVVLYCGRYFLRVGGVYVAMETDPCRDTLTTDKVWGKEALDIAAEKINAAAATPTLEPRKQTLDRLARFQIVADEIYEGLQGRPFQWRGVDGQHKLPVARAMGITLVSKTRAEKLGYTLKRGQKPVGRRYFGAPISRVAEVYVLECQFNKTEEYSNATDTPYQGHA